MSFFSEYVAFSQAVKDERNWTCQVCTKHNPHNYNKSPLDMIVCHHIYPVVVSGFISPLLTNRNNILVVCGFCHHTVCHGKSLSMAEHDSSHSMYTKSVRSSNLRSAEQSFTKSASTIRDRLLAHYGC